MMRGNASTTFGSVRHRNMVPTSGGFREVQPLAVDMAPNSAWSLSFSPCCSSSAACPGIQSGKFGTEVMFLFKAFGMVVFADQSLQTCYCQLLFV